MNQPSSGPIRLLRAFHFRLVGKPLPADEADGHWDAGNHNDLGFALVESVDTAAGESR